MYHLDKVSAILVFEHRVHLAVAIQTDKAQRLDCGCQIPYLCPVTYLWRQRIV